MAALGVVSCTVVKEVFLAPGNRSPGIGFPRISGRPAPFDEIAFEQNLSCPVEHTLGSSATWIVLRDYSIDDEQVGAFLDRP